MCWYPGWCWTLPCRVPLGFHIWTVDRLYPSTFSGRLGVGITNNDLLRLRCRFEVPIEHECRTWLSWGFCGFVAFKRSHSASTSARVKVYPSSTVKWPKRSSSTVSRSVWLKWPTTSSNERIFEGWGVRLEGRWRAWGWLNWLDGLGPLTWFDDG